MRVLVACEFSGVIREAFRRRGHDAWSLDLLPALDKSLFHIQGDLLQILGTYKQVPMKCNRWDLAIFHPTCRYLTNSGVKHLYLDGKKVNGRDEQRWRDMQAGVDFFRFCLDAAEYIPRIAIENPIPHGHAAELIGRDYDQIIEPWMFGHMETKKTCIWIINLPLLQPTNDVHAETMKLPKGKRGRVHYESPGIRNGLTREQRRSITLPGVAAAMAEQWGKLSAVGRDGAR